jgi:hypothetical protein
MMSPNSRPRPYFRDYVKAGLVIVDFPENQYVREPVDKKQITLHHTGSGKGADGDYQTWKSNKERIATCCIVDHLGNVAQCFPSMFWGFHLGVTNDQIAKYRPKEPLSSSALNAMCVALEIDCWGFLKKVGGEWRSYPNNFGKSGPKTVIDEKNIQFYPNGFKGFEAFEKYTAAQIETTRQLLLYWSACYKIDITYKEDIWDVTSRAMTGENGLFTHNSYRKDKTDIHPQPEMIKMLQSLKK